MNMPQGTTARLELRPPSRQCRLVLTPPGTGKDEAVLRRGSVLSLIEFDAGMSWPDRTGERLAEAVLDEGECIIFAFANLADALRCQTRLAKIGVRGCSL